MKTSVIKSLILGALVVMLASLLVLTLVFFYNVKSGIETDTYSEMNEFVEHIKPITQMSLDFSTSRMMKFYNETMHQFTHFSRFSVLVAANNGEIVWSDFPVRYPGYKEKILSANKALEKKNKIQAENMLSGIYSGRTMTLAVGVKSEISGNSRTIFCTVKTPNLVGRFFDILLEIMLMELVSLLFMAIFLYQISKTITNPLAKINKALKAFSKGDFSKRVEYTSSNELGELAQNVNSMADGLENLEKMRYSFVSDVSHELRTPMTSITGFIEGILDGTIPKEDNDKYLKIVLSETKRLSRIVNELLSVSKLESGTLKLDITSFDILELSKIVLLNFEKEITEKNISVSVQTGEEHCFVCADKDSCTQVMINLIHNAVKFTPEDGSIALCFEEEDTKCRITVKNSGEGIEADKIAFIWERFYKTDNSRSSDKSGVGLGLYIVKRILDAHDEKITVSCDEEKNTSFSFTLPLS